MDLFDAARKFLEENSSEMLIALPIGGQAIKYRIPEKIPFQTFVHEWQSQFLKSRGLFIDEIASIQAYTAEQIRMAAIQGELRSSASSHFIWLCKEDDIETQIILLSKLKYFHKSPTHEDRLMEVIPLLRNMYRLHKFKITLVSSYGAQLRFCSKIKKDCVGDILHIMENFNKKYKLATGNQSQDISEVILGNGLDF